MGRVCQSLDLTQLAIDYYTRALETLPPSSEWIAECTILVQPTQQINIKDGRPERRSWNHRRKPPSELDLLMGAPTSRWDQDDPKHYSHPGRPHRQDTDLREVIAYNLALVYQKVGRHAEARTLLATHIVV